MSFWTKPRKATRAFLRNPMKAIKNDALNFQRSARRGSRFVQTLPLGKLLRMTILGLVITFIIVTVIQFVASISIPRSISAPSTKPPSLAIIRKQWWTSSDEKQDQRDDSVVAPVLSMQELASRGLTLHLETPPNTYFDPVVIGKINLFSINHSLADCLQMLSPDLQPRDQHWTHFLAYWTKKVSLHHLDAKILNMSFSPITGSDADVALRKSLETSDFPSGFRIDLSINEVCLVNRLKTFPLQLRLIPIPVERDSGRSLLEQHAVEVPTPTQSFSASESPWLLQVFFLTVLGGVVAFIVVVKGFYPKDRKGEEYGLESAEDYDYFESLPIDPRLGTVFGFGHTGDQDPNPHSHLVSFITWITGSNQKYKKENAFKEGDACIELVFEESAETEMTVTLSKFAKRAKTKKTKQPGERAEAWKIDTSGCSPAISYEVQWIGESENWSGEDECQHSCIKLQALAKSRVISRNLGDGRIVDEYLLKDAFKGTFRVVKILLKAAQGSEPVKITVTSDRKPSKAYGEEVRGKSEITRHDLLAAANGGATVVARSQESHIERKKNKLTSTFPSAEEFYKNYSSSSSSARPTTTTHEQMMIPKPASASVSKKTNTKKFAHSSTTCSTTPAPRSARQQQQFLYKPNSINVLDYPYTAEELYNSQHGGGESSTTTAPSASYQYGEQSLYTTQQNGHYSHNPYGFTAVQITQFGGQQNL